MQNRFINFIQILLPKLSTKIPIPRELQSLVPCWFNYQLDPILTHQSHPIRSFQIYLSTSKEKEKGRKKKKNTGRKTNRHDRREICHTCTFHSASAREGWYGNGANRAWKVSTDFSPRWKIMEAVVKPGQLFLGYLREYPRVGRVARPEGRIEIRGRDESSISRRPMRLLRPSPPTRPRSVLRFTMCLR